MIFTLSIHFWSNQVNIKSLLYIENSTCLIIYSSKCIKPVTSERADIFVAQSTSAKPLHNNELEKWLHQSESKYCSFWHVTVLSSTFSWGFLTAVVWVCSRQNGLHWWPVQRGFTRVTQNHLPSFVNKKVSTHLIQILQQTRRYVG